MAQAFRSSLQTTFSENFTADELVAHLVDAEWDLHYNRKLQRTLKLANFRYQAWFEQLDFTQKRHLDKNLMLRLSTCSWIEIAEYVLISGPTGVGKSYIACALGHQACLQGFRCLYFNTMKLFTKLKFARADGTYDTGLLNLWSQKDHAFC